MSDYAVHFTKGTVANTPLNVLSSILSSGTLNASGPFGAARTLWMLDDTQSAVCFSEIPLDLLDRLVQRRSSYGVGFHQTYLTEQGGGRVWYLDKDSHAAAAFKELIETNIQGGIDSTEPFWKLTPLVDFPGDYGFTSYRFEWEREWRHPGPLSFSPGDVSFLFLPEAHHQSISKAHPEFSCPLIDPTWSIEAIQGAVSEMDEPVPDVPGDMDFDGWASLCAYCGGEVWDGQCQVCGLPGL